MAVVGVDGCTHGWVGVVLGSPPDDRPASLVAAPRFADLVAHVPEAEVVAVDMPVGLRVSGVRQADLAARAALQRRWATVFLAPALPAVAAATYAEANQAHRRATGGGLSRQAWALAAKIQEVEAWRTSSGRPAWEVHPEVAFAELNGAPLAAGKKSWSGMTGRRSLLAAAGITVPDDPGPAGVLAGVDDVLDATAVAWVARRIAGGQARPLPDPPELDHLGRPIAIWV